MAPTTQIAIPIVSNHPPLADQLRAAYAAGAGLVELRVDLIDDVAAVERLLQGPAIVPTILTVRAADEGGAWAQDDATRVALIERLGLLGPEYVDIELATWQRSANLRQKIGLVATRTDQPIATLDRRRGQLILSHHDFRTTPTDLDARLAQLEATPAHVLKAVFRPRDATDALRVMAALAARAQQRPWVLLALDEAGLVSRVLARKFGAFLTFATLGDVGASAPGQPSLTLLRDVYRWDAITPQTRVYGVVGWPVTHSLSPHIHNAALAAAGVDGVYLPFPVRADQGDFNAFMNYVAAHPQLDIHGLSVTIPHKEHALQWLRARGGALDAVSAACGAVNTLVRRPGGTWSGMNTDALGVRAALTACPRLHTQTLAGQSIAILGAGGAARAAAAALVADGCHVTVYNRSPQRAAQLAADLGCSAAPWETRGATTAEIIINCTSVGLHPHVNETPLPAETLRPEQVVFDTIYRPARTRLLREAAERGCATISGLDMFLAQAAAQFTAWHGQPPPAGVMQRVLDRVAG